MSLSRSYAQAFIEAVAESNQAANFEAFETELAAFASTVDASAELQKVLWGPITNEKQKAAVVEALCARLSAKPLVRQFLVLLARKNRMQELRKILKTIKEVFLTRQGVVFGSVLSAEPLAEAEVTGLAKAFGDKLKKKVAFDVEVDPSLMAGLKVTVNGVTYDGTLKSQIQRLKDRMLSL